MQRKTIIKILLAIAVAGAVIFGAAYYLDIPLDECICDYYEV